MKRIFQYSIGVCFTVIVVSACSNRNNESDGNEAPAVNVSDSRRNTPGSVNTITGDSNKVATDSAQHEIRNKKRESM
jgi:hypothetical protein